MSRRHPVVSLGKAASVGIVVIAVFAFCQGGSQKVDSSKTSVDSPKGSVPTASQVVRTHACAALQDVNLKADSASGAMPAEVIGWPTLYAPEFQDDQRFTVGSGSGRHYGPIACVISHPDLASKTEGDFGSDFGVFAAAIYVGSSPAIATGDPYDQLHLRAGWNCLWLRKQGSAMRSYMTPVSGGACGAIVAGTHIANTHRLHETATVDADYPGVARFVEMATSWRAGIAVKCVDQVCIVGIPVGGIDSRAHGVPTAGTAGYVRRAVLSWHDQQHLALGTPLLATVKASIVPVDNLGSLTLPSHFTSKPRVAEVYLPDGVDHSSKYYVGWGFTRSGPKPNDIALELTDSAHPEVPASWKVWVNGVYMKRLHVTYTKHGGTIPATARFRWTDSDEDVWVRCIEGCCLVDM